VGNQQLLSQGDYQAFQRYLQEACGIVLGNGKEYLVTSRLGGLMRENGIATVGELLRQVNGASNRSLRVSIIDAMTTNETFWFRDMAHFNLLSDMILPEVGSGRGKRVRIWSAACSYGQEPYNISMTVQRYVSSKPGALPGDVEILGTDISTKVLEHAKSGAYCGLSASRGLDDDQRRRFFDQRGDCLEVRPEIRRRVSFRNQNIMESYALLGRFDVIFCRNMLIYFSAEKKADIIARMARVLNPGGYLFLGSTESLTAHLDLFEMVNKHRGIVYRLR